MGSGARPGCCLFTFDFSSCRVLGLSENVYQCLHVNSCWKKQDKRTIKTGSIIWNLLNKCISSLLKMKDFLCRFSLMQLSHHLNAPSWSYQHGWKTHPGTQVEDLNIKHQTQRIGLGRHNALPVLHTRTGGQCMVRCVKGTRLPVAYSARPKHELQIRGDQNCRGKDVACRKSMDIATPIGRAKIRHPGIHVCGYCSSIVTYSKFFMVSGD